MFTDNVVYAAGDTVILIINKTTRVVDRMVWAVNQFSNSTVDVELYDVLEVKRELLLPNKTISVSVDNIITMSEPFRPTTTVTMTAEGEVTTGGAG